MAEEYPWKKEDFAVPPRGTIYLNPAGRTPMHSSVMDVSVKCISWKREPWNPIPSTVSIISEVKELYSSILHCDPLSIAIAPSTAYAMSIAAKNIMKSGRLAPGKKIIITMSEMASNVYPWQNACEITGASLEIIPFPQPNETWADVIISRLDTSVEVLALSMVHWCDGSIVDLEKISAFVEGLGPRPPYLVVDGTQSIGMIPFDTEKIKADFIAASAHKWLLAPYGTSLMYLHPKHFSTWEPLEFHEKTRAGADSAGWDEVGTMTVDGYPTAFQAGASRINMGGAANPVQIPAVCQALSLVVEWGPAVIQRYVGGLIDLLARRITELEIGLSVLPANRRSPHILGIRLVEEVLGSVSASEVVAGMRARGILMVARHGLIRVSMYVTNTVVEVETIADTLKQVVQELVASRRNEGVKDEVLGTRQKKVVLLIGGSGWLGQFLTRGLIRKLGFSTVDGNKNPEEEVHVTYSSSEKPFWLPSDRSHRLDLSESNGEVEVLLKRLKPTVVVLLAALSSPLRCERDPGAARSINCPSSVVEAIRALDAEMGFDTTLVFTSTDLVYCGENPPYKPIKKQEIELEGSCCNMYAQTKLDFEQQVLSLKNGLILRLSNMLGPSCAYTPSGGPKFLQWLYESFRKRDKVSLKNDEIRSFVAVCDVVELICAIVKQSLLLEEDKKGLPEPRVFNVGGPEGLSRLDVASLLASSLDTNLDFSVDNQEQFEIEGRKDKNVPWKVSSVSAAEFKGGPNFVPAPRDVTMDSSGTEERWGVRFCSVKELLEKMKNEICWDY